MAAPKKRPIIQARERRMFGEAMEKPEFNDPALAAGDLTFIPGYSDKRRAFDRAVARGEDPVPLTHRYQLVRIKNALGGPDSRSAAQWRMQGYREVKQDELPGLGIELPVGGHVTAEGFVEVGDTRLFVCGAQRAARNEENWRRATDEMQADDRAPALEREAAKYAKPGEELHFAEGEHTDASG